MGKIAFLLSVTVMSWTIIFFAGHKIGKEKGYKTGFKEGANGMMIYILNNNESPVNCFPKKKELKCLKEKDESKVYRQS